MRGRASAFWLVVVRVIMSETQVRLKIRQALVYEGSGTGQSPAIAGADRTKARQLRLQA